MNIQWIMLTFLWHLSSFASASQHPEVFKEIEYAYERCPSYCDSTGETFEPQVCPGPKSVCCHIRDTLSCCTNQTLAIGSDVGEEHNCKQTIENWEIIMAVCVPLAAISLFAFFAMLSVILVKKRRQSQSARSRASSTGSCSSCTSTRTSPGRARASFSHNDSDTSGTASHGHSIHHNRNVFMVSSTRRGHRRQRRTPLNPTVPPPYLEKPPSYIELYGSHVEETSDTESTHFYGDVAGPDLVHTRPPEYDGRHVAYQTQILDARRLMRERSNSGNVQLDIVQNSIAQDQETDFHTYSDQVSENSNVNESVSVHSPSENVEQQLNSSTLHCGSDTETDCEYQIRINRISNMVGSDTQTDTYDTVDNESVAYSDTYDTEIENDTYVCAVHIEPLADDELYSTDAELGHWNRAIDVESDPDNTAVEHIHNINYSIDDSYSTDEGS